MRLLRVLRGALGRSPAAARAVGAFSDTGEHAAVWHAIGLGGIVLGRATERARWRRAMLVVGITQGANSLVKVVVRRRRPALPDLPALVRTPTGLSFPSGHASSSFAAARAFSVLLPPAPLYALASAMALSRVLLGVHFPSDVAAGAVLGTLIAGRAR